MGRQLQKETRIALTHTTRNAISALLALLAVGCGDVGAESLTRNGVDESSSAPIAAGDDFADQFTVTPTRAVWEVPAGSELARTTHVVFATISDLAGNARHIARIARESYNASSTPGSDRSNQCCRK